MNRNPQTQRGPAPKDPEWSAIIATAKENLPSNTDTDTNREMVAEWRDLDAKWKGCAINSIHFKRADGRVWRCQMYLAGQQRVIMRGTLYQCARCHDAALIRFARFRSAQIDINNPANFNFPIEQAKKDQGDGDFVAWLEGLETCLKNQGVQLLTAEQRTDQRTFHKAEYAKKKYTVGGRIEARLDVVMTTLAAFEQELKGIGTRLAQMDARNAMLISERAHAPEKKTMAEWLTQHDPIKPVVHIDGTIDFDPALPADRSLEQIPIDPFDQ